MRREHSGNIIVWLQKCSKKVCLVVLWFARKVFLVCGTLLTFVMLIWRAFPVGCKKVLLTLTWSEPWEKNQKLTPTECSTDWSRKQQTLTQKKTLFFLNMRLFHDFYCSKLAWPSEVLLDYVKRFLCFRVAAFASYGAEKRLNTAGVKVSLHVWIRWKPLHYAWFEVWLR